MKKILGIVGSPRKLGNSEMFIKEISNHIPEPHELTLLRLADFSILPCIGCYQCLFKTGQCILKDDFYSVFNPIVEADAIIVAAPAYFLGANASLKRFLDRGLAFYSQAKQLWGKPSVGVAIAGIPEKEGYTLLGVQNFLKMLLTDVKRTAVIYGALPGEVFLDEGNRECARQLGEALFKDKPAPERHTCPLCGGDTFRFLPDQRVRCMLCSHTGTMELTSDGPVFSIEKGDHPMFLTLEDVLNHLDWLRQMKGRFLEHKNELKQISHRYRKGWQWIQASKDVEDV